MRAHIERQDILDAIKHPNLDIGFSDLVCVLREWANEQRTFGYDVSKVLTLLDSIEKEGTNLHWIGGQKK